MATKAYEGDIGGIGIIGVHQSERHGTAWRCVSFSYFSDQSFLALVL